MILKLENPRILADVVSIISELVTEVKIRVDKLGLKIIAIDPANVALVSFLLPSSSFSNFEVTEEVLGISLDSLKSVLKRCGIGSSLVLQSEDNVLKIEIQDKIKRSFTLALINIDTEEKTMPVLDFTCKVEIPSLDLLEAVEDCSIVADSCSFSIKDSKFVIEAKGLNSAKSEFSGDEAKIEGDKGKAKYSIEYLNKFCRACKLSEKATINFSDDYPLKLEFSSKDFGLAFVLAPRVENDD
ncbi:MAG: proliferating cell nuclear antigen (pcna) [Candidatus Pacearchaeota archaeon]|nr:proliferating cell nuclear antigen (pcna) [Candidatus Pacearchaeota archaeon]